MNWVAPITDDRALDRFESELSEIDDKYYIMFEIGIGTGMQVQDILKLKVKDIRGKDSITIKIGKQQAEQMFEIPKDLKETITAYTEGKDPDSYLLLGHKNSSEPLTREQAYRVLNKAGRKIGLTSIGAQTMRKTWAWRYYHQTGDIYHIQHLLNHASPSITYRYIGEKPNMEVNIKKLTSEENEQSRSELCIGHAGEKRIMKIVNSFNEISDSLNDPCKHDTYFGCVACLLDNVEDLLMTFRQSNS